MTASRHAAVGRCMELRHGRASVLGIFYLLVLVVWSAVLFGLLTWNIRSESRQTWENALYEARAFFEEIVTARYWNALHGGVYVPVSKEASPNPFLDVPDRDVVTTDGRTLTKINPAYMTRQIGEIASERNIVGFHITSEDPIRPMNAPTPWEKQALRAFETGAPEQAAFVESPGGGTTTFRYMAPLWVEGPCLRCHAKQGYREGDLRGGISVSIQAGPMIASQRLQIRRLAMAYSVIWVLGFAGISLGMWRLHREDRRREELIARLQTALATVKALRGLLPICSSCKKVRDDDGYWHQVEAYITKHSEAQFSHGICPDCARELYPELCGEPPARERDPGKDD